MTMYDVELFFLGVFFIKLFFFQAQATGKAF